MPTSRLLADEERAVQSPRGEEPLGKARADQPDRHAVVGRRSRVAGVPYIGRVLPDGEALGYLDSLTQEAERKGRRVVAVLDNPMFDKAGAVRDARPGWEAKGLELYYLPAYCPHLNLIEGAWKRLKGFLMPRRYYDSLAELKQAVLNALRLLGAVELQC